MSALSDVAAFEANAIVSSCCFCDVIIPSETYILAGTSSCSSAVKDVMSEVSFVDTRQSNIIPSYETRRIRELEKENQMLRRRIDEMQRCSTESIKFRVFSDGDTSIRIKAGKNPVFKVAIEDGVYVATWRKRILGYSTLRDGLLEEVNQTVVFLWNEYAMASPEILTASARRLRKLLLDVFEEI